MRRGMAVLGLVALAAGAGCSSPAPQRTVLRLAYQHELVTLDPFGHDDAVTRSVLGAVYEPLVRIGPMLEVKPCLAERWETPDDLTWRFKLRPGVLFHDGTPLSVEDAVASIQHAVSAPGSRVATYLTAIAAVKALPDEPGTIEVVTSHPAPLLLTRLSLVPVVPAAVLRDPSHPVGTGPYRWVDGSLAGPVHLTAWERYWGEKPAADEVVVEAIPDEKTVVQRVESGRLDVVSEISLRSLPGGRPPAGWQLVPFPPAATTILACNVTRPPLDDVRVRGAIDLALDRHALAARAASGRVKPAYGLVPQGVVGSLPVETVPRSDPERARRLLARAGYPDGVDLELEHAGVWPPVVAFLEQALARVGIRLHSRLESYDEFYRRVLDRQCQLYIFGWSFPFGDASDLLDALVHTRDPARRLGLQNGSGYSDPQVDRWIEQAGRETRSTLRQDLIRKALVKLGEDRPYIPLYHRVRLALVREGYSLQPYGTGWLSPQCVVRGGR